jgi:signal peptidase II
LKKSYLVFLVLFVVLVIDQVLKIWVKTTFGYNQSRPLFGHSEWAQLNFVENPGMAFGWKFGGEFGKLALSLFRLVAISFLIYYVVQLVKRNVNTGLLISFSLILAGAIGNMIDSAFYGMIFTESVNNYHSFDTPTPAKLVPMGQGYAGFLHGKVVDMLFFPLYKNAQGEVLFFQPVFNIADSAITIGVLSILLFQRSYFNEVQDKHASSNAVETPVENVVESENTEGVDEVKNEKTDEEKDS